MKVKLLLVAILLFICFACSINPAREHYDKGLELAEKGNYTAAIQEYNKAIEIDSSHAESYHHRARARYEIEDYEGVRTDVYKAIELGSEGAKKYFRNLMARDFFGGF